MKFKKSWLIPFLVTATAGIAFWQSGADVPTTQPQSDCVYTWAYHDAPEASAEFTTRLKAVHPAVEASVSLYGEDCVYADGRQDFHPLESDFYVRLPVTNLQDEAAFGNWMAQALEAALTLPPETLQGSFGFVEFWFIKSDTEQAIVRVPLADYLANGRGKSGAELYQLYQP